MACAISCFGNSPNFPLFLLQFMKGIFMEPKINIFEDLDGKKIVMIHDIRFKGKRKINWKEVESYLKEYVGSCYEIAETAEKIYIGTTLPDEFSWSDDSKRLQGTLAKAKANAAQGIQQLIEVASNKRYQENMKEKHTKKKKNGWYRYTSNFALPVYDEDGNTLRYNVFRIEMLVRHAKDGKMYLYDMVNIKKRTEQTV